MESWTVPETEAPFPLLHVSFLVGLGSEDTTSSPGQGGTGRCGLGLGGSGSPAAPGYLRRWRGHPQRRAHSPIFPLGFVDVTISASANFAALVFKQVLDPLPFAAQLHFKVTVHCHSLRGRRAGSGAEGPGGDWGERRRPQHQSARSQPPAAAPARPTLQGRDQAPRGRRGHPGESRAVPAAKAWGGERRLPLCPGSRGAGSRAVGRTSRWRDAGSGWAATPGSGPLTRAFTPHLLSHTLTLTPAPIRSNRSATPHNSRYPLGERRAGRRAIRPPPPSHLHPAPGVATAPSDAGTRKGLGHPPCKALRNSPRGPTPAVPWTETTVLGMDGPVPWPPLPRHYPSRC